MAADTKCPICRKPSSQEHAPFCSRGCKDRDLINWLSESYKAPVNDDEESESSLDQGLDSESDPRL